MGSVRKYMCSWAALTIGATERYVVAAGKIHPAAPEPGESAERVRRSDDIRNAMYAALLRRSQDRNTARNTPKYEERNEARGGGRQRAQCPVGTSIPEGV